MKALYTILLLIVSNVFMTFAWYGHLKMKQEYSWFAALPLIGVIAFSWSIAFFEYSCQIPANRIGYVGNGGPFSLMQLKVLQEVITLIIFTVFTTVFFKGEALHWNHIAAFVCLILAVTLEPCCGVRLPCSCRLFCIYEIVIEKSSIRVYSNAAHF